MQNQSYDRHESLVTSASISDLDLSSSEQKIKLEEGSQDHLVDSPCRDSEASTKAEVPKSENETNHQHNENSETIPKEEENNSNIIDFTPTDPSNPKNWPYHRKWLATTLISLISFITAASSSSVAPALPILKSDFNLTQIQASAIFAIYGFGFVIGSIPYGPLSEIYGRGIVLHVAFFVFLVFNLASGFARTYAQLMVFRILSAVGGSAPNTIGAGVVSDLFNAEDIGRGSAFYGLAPRLGPALGPLIGGFIIQNLSWRWSFYITSIIAGFLFISGIIFIPETRPSVLLERKAKKLNQQQDSADGKKDMNKKEYKTKSWPRPEGDLIFLKEGMKRPFIFLGKHHIVQYLALFQFFLAGTLYLILSTYGTLWRQEYGESIQISGLNYISIGLGLVIGNQLCSRVSDKVYNYLRHRHPSSDPSDPDAGRPEYRVPLMLVGSILYPIGFLLYSWTSHYHTFWLLPNIGIFLVAAGIIILAQGIKLYNVSTYGTYAASAQGAVNFMRAIGSGIFPLFATFMLDALGYGWTGTLLAGVAVALGGPGTVVLWFYGERLRRRAEGLGKTVGGV